MSHQQQYQEQRSFLNQLAGSINFNTFNPNIHQQQEELGGATTPTNRRGDTNSVYRELYRRTYIVRPGERVVFRTSGRLNKNEILGLTLALLTKEKYLFGGQYSRDLELFRGIQMNSSSGEFVLVLRTDGRIVAMSDEVEHHLGKSMRSLYTQCINIFECLDTTDGNRLQSILNSSVDLTHQEHRLVCTFRLPKGKRPSRTREDIKTITMVGHFYACNETSSPNERLFIARCEALVSRVATGSNSSQTTMINTNTNNNTNSMVKLTLNEDMSISMVSSNVQDILGYSRNEMMGNWLGRYLATNDLEKFENIRHRYFQHEQQQQQSPTSICDIFDMYTNNGDGRLTFLFQIRPIRERRSKATKFAIVAQLIDPSLRNEYIKYVQPEPEATPKPIKAEQYHHQYRTRAKIQSWPPTVRHSPMVSLCSTMPIAMTLPMSSNIRHSLDHSQTLLPRSMSMNNLGSNYSTSIIHHQEQQIFDSGQQNLSMMLSTNVNPDKN